MVQTATIIPFPGVTRLPVPAPRRRVTKAGWDNTLLFEVLALSDHLRETVAAIDCRIQEIKSRNSSKQA